MTDPLTIPESTPSKRTRESAPWRVARFLDDTDDGGDMLPTLVFDSLADAPHYDDLKECERECKKLAQAKLGTRYAPVKCGTIFQAEEVRRVEVKRT